MIGECRERKMVVWSMRGVEMDEDVVLCCLSELGAKRINGKQRWS